MFGLNHCLARDSERRAEAREGALGTSEWRPSGRLSPRLPIYCALAVCRSPGASH